MCSDPGPPQRPTHDGIHSSSTPLFCQGNSDSREAKAVHGELTTSLCRRACALLSPTMFCVLRLQLAIVHDQHNDRVLLGRKKKGFGEVSPQVCVEAVPPPPLPPSQTPSAVRVQGYYNGFGGKVEPGETIAEAAHREVGVAACMSEVLAMRLSQSISLKARFFCNCSCMRRLASPRRSWTTEASSRLSLTTSLCPGRSTVSSRAAVPRHPAYVLLPA